MGSLSQSGGDLGRWKGRGGVLPRLFLMDGRMDGCMDGCMYE